MTVAPLLTLGSETGTFILQMKEAPSTITTGNRRCSYHNSPCVKRVVGSDPRTSNVGDWKGVQLGQEF